MSNIEVDEVEGLEAWRNATPGVHGIKRVGEKGRMVGELVNPGRVFHLSPQERRAIQRAVYSSAVDPFTNGIFEPVQLIETEKDVASLTGNPNQVTETEMAALLKGSQAKFDAAVADLTNPVVVKRMLAVAEEGDTSIKKVAVLKARIAELDPTAEFTNRIEHRGNVHTPIGSDPNGGIRPER